MQLIFHVSRRTPHDASRLVLAMSAWSVEIRRAPSRHCRDARVFGHTTTAMHEYRVHPPPAPTSRLVGGGLQPVKNVVKKNAKTIVCILRLRCRLNRTIAHHGQMIDSLFMVHTFQGR